MTLVQKQFYVCWRFFCRFIHKSKKYHTHIQTIAAVIQAALAFIMVFTLAEGCKALKISQNQFESTVEPYIDITFNPLVLTNTITGKLGSNNYFIFDTLLSNVTTNQNLEMASRTVAVFKNEGAVDIANVEKVFSIKIKFDNYNAIENQFIDNNRFLIAQCLNVNHKAEYNFLDDPTLMRMLHENRDDRANEIMVYVIRYSRKLDMKPKYQFIMFTVMGTNPMGEHPFIMPLSAGGFITYGGSEIEMWQLRENKAAEFLGKYGYKVSE